MPTSNNNTKRIAKNSVFLYGRTIITMIISLYTSRIILRALGVDDFGIYNVVGGFVMMFSLLSGSLSAATQRFITFELGENNNKKSQQIFSVAVAIHFALALLIIILIESAGIWFLNSKMNIQPNRLIAANWVFQCSILTFALDLISIPYNASIIAHEKMNAFAYIGIFESSMKLLLVYLLLIINGDKLIIYSLLMLALAALIRFIYGVYCKNKFVECHFSFIKDPYFYRKMTGFAGWNFFGNASYILMTQGVNILINIFFGVTMNAARGIAVQVQNAIMQFVNNFTTALNPQITKSYASGDYTYLYKIVKQGSRFSFYLFFLLALPVFIEAPSLLELWLKTVPPYTVVFLRLTLINIMISLISNTLVTLMLATGNIKKYQLIVGTIGFLVFPVSYLLFKLGFPPYVTYLVNIAVYIIQLICRLSLLKEMVNFNIKDYVFDVIVNIIIVLSISIIIPLYLYLTLEQKTLNNILIVLICFLSSIITIYFIGANSNERRFLNNLIKTKIHLLIK